MGQDYVIMWRQKASDVVFPNDVETIHRDLEQGCKQLQGFHYQIVLRELQTLSAIQIGCTSGRGPQSKWHTSTPSNQLRPAIEMA